MSLCTGIMYHMMSHPKIGMIWATLRGELVLESRVIISLESLSNLWNLSRIFGISAIPSESLESYESFQDSGIFRISCQKNQVIHPSGWISFEISCHNFVKISLESLESFPESLESLESHRNLWNRWNLSRISRISAESWKSHQNLWNLIRIFRILSETLESYQNLWNLIRIIGIFPESFQDSRIFGISCQENELFTPRPPPTISTGALFHAGFVSKSCRISPLSVL